MSHDEIPALRGEDIAIEQRAIARRYRGRPTVYREDIAEEILARLADGESLDAICRSRPDMPAPRTVRRWVMKNEAGFAPEYHQAIALKAEQIAEDTLDIADQAPDDSMSRVRKAELRINARQWYLSKVASKRFGNKTETELTGSVVLDSASPAELARRVAALLVEQHRSAALGTVEDADYSEVPEVGSSNNNGLPQRTIGDEGDRAPSDG